MDCANSTNIFCAYNNHSANFALKAIVPVVFTLNFILMLFICCFCRRRKNNPEEPSIGIYTIDTPEVKRDAPPCYEEALQYPAPAGPVLSGDCSKTQGESVAGVEGAVQCSGLEELPPAYNTLPIEITGKLQTDVQDTGTRF